MVKSDSQERYIAPPPPAPFSRRPSYVPINKLSIHQSINLSTTNLPSYIANAVQELDWQIVGPPRQHPEGVVYLCRDAAGITEPYTEAVILDELARMKRFARLVLLAAGRPPEFATVAACLRNTQLPILNILPQEATP